jgi:DNA-binding PadR family transcriptional regulator
MSQRFLILGLLSERPMTGYDIKKVVETTLNTVTNASYGSLYPTLHKLLDEGAVVVDEVPQRGRPSKKIYQITDKGRQELVEWLQKPAAADHMKREFLLKVYLAKDLSCEQLHTLIESRRDDVEQMIATLRHEQTVMQEPRHTWVIECILSQCLAEIEWLNKIEAQIGIA